MPACFQLFPILANGEVSREPATINSVDEAICAHFNIPVDPVKYYAPPYEPDWFNYIGLALALGHSFPEIIERMNDAAESLGTEPYTGLIAVAEFLQSRYSPNSFSSR